MSPREGISPYMQPRAIRPVLDPKRRKHKGSADRVEDADTYCGVCGNPELGEVGAEGEVMKCPEEPSAEEVARHFAMGHPHFQAWCPHCVRGRGGSAPHRRGGGDEEGIP